MNLELKLERFDRRIRDAREAIENAYANRVPDERKDALYEPLDVLLYERDHLRRRWSREMAWWETLRGVSAVRAAFVELGLKIREIVERFLPELQRLDSERKRSRPAFWREVAGREPRASVTNRAAFSIALPANRRPILPGHMKQKGRG